MSTETPNTKPWTYKPCFSGPDCWCRIVVDPDGEDCTNYGELSEEDCQYIVDAMNKTPGAEKNVHPTHPVPWYACKGSGRYHWITIDPDAEDDLEASVGGVREEYIHLFVETVNEFYGGKG